MGVLLTNKYRTTIKSFVLFSLASFFSISSSGLAESAQDCLDSPFPLKTSGRYVVNACGERFKLKSVNWFGASDSSEVVLGLDKQPLEFLAKLIRDRGFNSIRLPFSNQMLYNSNPVDDRWLTANPRLKGMTPLEVFDEVVQALTDAGLAVILNNHTTSSEWCCSYDTNGLWYTRSGPWRQTTEMWQDDWLMLVERYKDNKAVVGVDLRNEVRTAKGRFFQPIAPNPDWKNENDWHMVAEETGNLLLERNSDLLIVVEGINWTGVLGAAHIPGLEGYRPFLQPIVKNPIYLNVPNRLVYAAHNYDFTGPRHPGTDYIFIAAGPRYKEMGRKQLFATLEKEWGFAVEQGKHQIAPVWVSEFGTGYNADEESQRWFKLITEYLLIKDLDFAYWPLNPEKTDGLDSFGLLKNDWSGFRDDWRFPYIDKLLSSD